MKMVKVYGWMSEWEDEKMRDASDFGFELFLLIHIFSFLSPLFYILFLILNI